MRKIAIVFGFSESCYELARQLIVSCYKAASLSQIDSSYHFIAYECNYNPAIRKSDPFLKHHNLQRDIPLDIEIHQLDSSKIMWNTWLPDIVVYHDFANHYMDEYDYTLFCHDDIYLKRHPVFEEIIHKVDDPTIGIVAKPVVATGRDLSIRFRPSFIFTRTDKFKDANLSFINEYEIMHKDIKAYPIYDDGGAGLLASYYNSNNTTKWLPFFEFPPTWYKHLRFDLDYGVEMYNLLNPNGPQFHQLLKRAKKYTDYHLYGRQTENK